MSLAYLDLYPEGGQAERLHETGSRAIADDQGLLGTTRVRGDADDLPEADGGIEPLDLYLGSRIITLSGEVWGATVQAARAEFAAIDVALRWSHHKRLLMLFRLDDAAAVDLQGYVRLIGDLPTRFQGGTAVLEYQAQLRAADPYWVSQSQKSGVVGAPSTSGGIPTPLPTPIPTGSGGGNTIAVTNVGNADAWPVITVQGPINGPVVENLTRGELLAFPALVVGAAQTLVIDTNPVTEAVTVGGLPVVGSLRWDDAVFPRITALKTETFRFYGLGGGYDASTNMTVAWRDTYTT